MKRIEYKGFFIDKTQTGYRVSVTDDTDRHSHLRNKKACYTLCDNVVAKRIPRRCGCYYLESHARLSDDEEYVRHIRDYIEVKQNKTKQHYYNPSAKKAGGNF